MMSHTLHPINKALIELIEERLKSENSMEYKKYSGLSDYEKIGYVQQNINKLDVGYDKQFYEEINKEIYCVLTKNIDKTTNKSLEKNFNPRDTAAMHNIIAFRAILGKYGNYVKNRTREDETRLSLMYYNLIIESAFIESVNVLAYLLVYSGLTYYRQDNKNNKFKSKNTYENIKKETLYNKLGFLKDNKIMLPYAVCNRHLRNACAHMNYIVHVDGTVFYEGPESVAEMSYEKLNNLIITTLNYCHCFSLIIRDARR